MTPHQLDTFTRAYIECALWSSLDDDDQPLDDWATVDDMALEALRAAVEDCADFQEAHRDDIGDRDKLAGYHFWLTRNGHGAGFWDGDWPQDVGARLTEASKVYGSVDLYVGDDERIHGGD